MTQIQKLTEVQRETVAEIDHDLNAVNALNAKYDRQILKDVVSGLERQAQDITDIDRALLAAEELGKLDATSGPRHMEMDAVQRRTSGIRAKVTKRIADFIKPIASSAAKAARQAAAKFEEEERAEAVEEGFKFSPSGKIGDLRDRGKHFDRLAENPVGALPSKDFADWLAQQRIS
jgi:hypothetical protein